MNEFSEFIFHDKYNQYSIEFVEVNLMIIFIDIEEEEEDHSC